MNPVQAIMGAFTPVTGNGGQIGQPMMNGPFGALQGVFQRAQQLAGNFQNPQQLVNQFFPDAPAEVRNDPDALANWLQQSGRVSPQMMQIARMAGNGR